MPELPEVETIVRQLCKEIKGKRITAFWTDNPKSIVTHSVQGFKKKVKGKKILDIQRKGKVILFVLSSGLILAIHLRLTGQLFVRKPTHSPDKYNHAKFQLGKNLELRFNDLRKFGQIWLFDKKQLEKNFSKIQKLGPDPLETQFTFEKFKKIVTAKKTRIKPLLMDQAKISGIGNIYSDEALFHARIHPLTEANKISPPKLKKLYQAIQKVLKEGIKYRGTSDQWYREVHGKKGGYQLKLKVYRRTSKPCPRCKTKIARVKVGGRSAHFCPKCQKIGNK